jgi:E3 ubiquitin-protein ligase HUWE1
MLSSIVWKSLCGSTIGVEDLNEVDSLFVKYLDEIKNCSEGEYGWKFGEDAEQKLSWTCVGGIGDVLVLKKERGEADGVAYADRLEYVDLCVEARLNELMPAIEMIKHGAFQVVPRRALALYTWKEVEVLVSGSPSFDMDLWKAHTHYSGYACDDDVVIMFWRVLESFTDEEKSNFCRFCWGRSRIPRSGQPWSSNFHITKRGDVNALPSAHTCFNSIELPPYTSEEVMRKKIVVAITFGVVGILNT